MVFVKPGDNSGEIYKKYAAAGRDGWVEPGPTTNRAIEVVNKYPNKRHIIHYHQPHTPFIGPTGMEYFDELPNKLGWIDGDIPIPDDIVSQAYSENVDIVLRNVAELLPYLNGKTVISADHGELLGERGFPIPIKNYGHRAGYYTDSLTRVPWFVLKYDQRRTITEEEPEYERDGEREITNVEERLKRLGYMQ